MKGLAAGKTLPPGRVVGFTLLGMGLTWGVAWLGSKAGFAGSRALAGDAVWVSFSWSLFPLVDVVGMLLGMVVLPLLVTSPRFDGKRVSGARIVAALAAGFGAVWLFGFFAPLRMQLFREGIASRFRLFFGLYFLIVAFSEESLFRGFLQQGIEADAGKGTALLAGSVFFAIWHGVPESWAQLALRLGAGLVFGCQFQFCRSLFPPVFLHWLVDLLQV